MLQLLTDCSPCGYTVDWLRSCYQGKWYLPDNGGTPVTAQYVFAPPDAPPYPFPHYYGSCNYVTETEVEDTTYGQVRSEETVYYNGAGQPDTPPPTLLSGNPCCTSACDSPVSVCGTGIVLPKTWVITVSFGGVSYSYAWNIVDPDSPLPTWELDGSTDFPLYCDGPPAPGPRGHWTATSFRFNCFVSAFDSDFTAFYFPLVGGPVEPYEVLQFLPFGTLAAGNYCSFTYYLNTGEETSVCGSGPTPPVTSELVIETRGTNSFVNSGAFVPADRSDWYLGFPPGCWRRAPGPTRRPWPFSPFDLDWRKDAASVLCNQYRDPDEAAVKFAALLGDAYTISRVDNGPDIVPGTLIGVSAGRCVVLVSGSTTVEQLVTQAFDSLSAPSNFGSYSTLPVWDGSATAILSRMTIAGVGASNEVAIAGHSYGGVVAQILAYRLARANPRRRISLLTFGTPPFGSIADGVWPANIVTSSIMNDGDPIGVLPPPSPYLLQLTSVQAGVPFNAWSGWTRPRQLTRLTTSGELLSSDQLSVQFAHLAELAGRAIAGDRLHLGNDHLMPEYVRRLALPFVPAGTCG